MTEEGTGVRPRCGSFADRSQTLTDQRFERSANDAANDAANDHRVTDSNEKGCSGAAPDTGSPSLIPLARILAGKRHVPVVYFARIGSNVKIGTTENLRSRMKSLYIPLENVLAVVPGGRDEEDAYHERFAASLTGDSSRRELFRIDHQLRDFLRPVIDVRPQENCLCSVVGGSSPMAPAEVTQVLRRLLAAPGGTTASKAAEAIGKSKSSAFAYLTALREQGVAELTRAGRASCFRLVHSGLPSGSDEP